MMISNALGLALREIRRNVLRSILTTLGIVIGVASVIAMIMLGDGTTAYVTQSISKLGTNMLILRPGQDRKGPKGADATAQPFTYADLLALRHDIPNLKAIAPSSSTSITAIAGNQNYATTIDGSDSSYFVVKDWHIERGRTFNDAELQGGKAVCVLGETVRKELFGTQDPIGQSIRLGKFNAEVIGLLRPKGASMFGMDQDDIIVIPIKLLQRRLSGDHDIKMILIATHTAGGLDNAKMAITALMHERRHIREGEEDDFHVRDMREMVQTLSSTTQMLTLLLGAVAAISLIVGGIGIMNIMLVSVTERTREIGIRMAIGAREQEVLLQFLIEAIVLSSLGGVIGIVLGVSIGVIVSSIFELPLVFNPMIIMIAFFFSSLVGIVFGYFPARKAARLNPIDALRYE